MTGHRSSRVCRDACFLSQSKNFGGGRIIQMIRNMCVCTYTRRTASSQTARPAHRRFRSAAHSHTRRTRRPPRVAATHVGLLPVLGINTQREECKRAQDNSATRFDSRLSVQPAGSEYTQSCQRNMPVLEISHMHTS